MLLTPKTIEDQIMMDLRHHCAEDPITGAYLIKSQGRRKFGRRTRFWYRIPGMINAKTIYATSVEDAICQIECGTEVPADGPAVPSA
jgi:hypothetical protein